MKVDSAVAYWQQEYNKDELYFKVLSDWLRSGHFDARVKPLIGFLKDAIKPDSVCLDAGCAVGAISLELALRGVKQIDAVDFSGTALRFAKENAQWRSVTRQIRFIEAALEDLSEIEDGVYDIIVAADVIEHIVDPSLMLRELHRVCKPNGLLLVETPNMLFRRHPWYERFDLIARWAKLSESRNLYPTDSKQDFGRYHVSLHTWPALVEAIRHAGFSIVKERPFGWWLKLGAADRMMALTARVGRLLSPSLRYYENTDVVVVARKK